MADPPQVIGWGGGVRLSDADAARDQPPPPRAPGRAALPSQLSANLTRSLVVQKRKWVSNTLIIAAPIAICALLLLLQVLANGAITQGRLGRCGCECTRCCDYVRVSNQSNGSNAYVYECYDARPDQLCSPYADCEEYNDENCGAEFSTPDQAVYCAETNPITWPPVLQVPTPDNRAARYAPKAPILFTGVNRTQAEAMASSLLNVIDEATAIQQFSLFLAAGGEGTNETMSTREQLEFFATDTRTFIDSTSVALGTSAPRTYSLYLEPAFIPMDQTGPGEEEPALYFLSQNCSLISQPGLDALDSMTYNQTGMHLYCLDAPTLWRTSPSSIQAELYCSDPRSKCIAIGSQQIPLESFDQDYGAADQLRTTPLTATSLVEQAQSESSSDPMSANNDDDLFIGPPETFGSYLFDFRSTEAVLDGVFDINIWYFDANNDRPSGDPPIIERVNRAINLATNGYLGQLAASIGLPNADAYSVLLSGLRGMPKPETRMVLDFSSLLGPLFYVWLLQMLLPLTVRNIVSEREEGLRSMMRVHGLADGVYWTSQILGHFTLYIFFVAAFILFGSIVGLQFFIANDLAIQIILYILWGLEQVAFAALLSTFFRSAQTAMVAVSLWVFASGLFASFFLNDLLDSGVQWAVWLELIPSFALYRGLYELAQYAFFAVRKGGTEGMQWSNLYDDGNGMIVVWIILSVETIVFLTVAVIAEKIIVHQTQIGALLFPSCFGGKKNSNKAVRPSSHSRSGQLSSYGENADIAMERDHAAQCHAKLMRTGTAGRSTPVILVNNLRKVYPGGKVACKDLSLTVARGECFGMLGPNGAGKSTTIGMLIGQTRPTSGSVYVNGKTVWHEKPAAADCADDDCEIHDDRTTAMIRRRRTTHANGRKGKVPVIGVCPQHDQTWPNLTGEEHLRYYARLRGVDSGDLAATVGALLNRLNLGHSGIPSRCVGTYSGGMRRRLSVGIALLGDPDVAFLDEPSTGLDPGSRRALWDAIMYSTHTSGVTILLTTHSMEEAEALCDRIALVADGQLQCIGSSRELTARYGKFMTLSLTTVEGTEAAEAVHSLVESVTPTAKKKYQLAGNIKYDLPSKDVILAELFQTMEANRIKEDSNGDHERGGDKSSSTREGRFILDWGITSATLEDVFIAVAEKVENNSNNNTSSS